MATLVVNPITSPEENGYELYNIGAVYATIHDAASGSADLGPYINLGQYLSGGSYAVYRGCMSFNTSSLGSSANITAATLQIYGYTNNSDTEFDLTIVSGTDIAVPAVAADYGDLLDETTPFGSVNTSSWTTTDWNTITLNASGLAAISKTGTTTFGFRSSRDISSTTPTGDEIVSFHSASGGGAHPPILTITYTITFIPKIFYF